MPSNIGLQKINRILTADVTGLKNNSNSNLAAFGLTLMKILIKKLKSE